MRTLLLLSIACLAFAGCTAPGQKDTMDDHSDEVMIDGSSYTLTATGVPETAHAGESFTFELTIAGPHGNSDHIGGHFWNATVPEPDTGSAEHKALRGSCQHTVGDLPATFTVTCTLDAEGTNTLFGHMAYTHDGTTYNYWTQAFHVEVGPADAM